METKKGKIYVLIGPTAVGKNTLISEVSARLDGLIRMPSATTRAPRPGEIDGVSKVFLTDEQFDQYIQQDAFVEWQVIHGYRYGVLKHIVQQRIDKGEDYLVDVEVLGALKLKEEYKENAILIFIVPPSMIDLEKRIRAREAESEKEIQIRLSRSKSELAYIPLCDHLLMNDDLEIAVNQLAGIVSKERSGNVSRNETLRNVTVKALILDENMAQVYMDDLDGKRCLPQVVVDRPEFPHQKLLDYLETQGMKGLLLEENTDFDQYNKGLEKHRPLWVSFHAANGQVTVEYVYVLKSEEGPESNVVIMPLDEVLQRTDLVKEMEMVARDLAYYMNNSPRDRI